MSYITKYSNFDETLIKFKNFISSSNSIQLNNFIKCLHFINLSKPPEHQDFKNIDGLYDDDKSETLKDCLHKCSTLSGKVYYYEIYNLESFKNFMVNTDGLFGRLRSDEFYFVLIEQTNNDNIPAIIGFNKFGDSSFYSFNKKKTENNGIEIYIYDPKTFVNVKNVYVFGRSIGVFERLTESSKNFNMYGKNPGLPVLKPSLYKKTNPWYSSTINEKDESFSESNNSSYVVPSLFSESSSETSLNRTSSKLKKKKSPKRIFKRINVNDDDDDDDHQNEDHHQDDEVTLEFLKHSINNDIYFIKSYTKSIKELMKTKLKRYTKIAKIINNEIIENAKKRDNLKKKGLKEQYIDTVVPFALEELTNLDFINEIMAEIKAKEINEEIIKISLNEAISDEEFGLESLIGRDDVKNTIAQQIFSFSKSSTVFVDGFQNIAIYGEAGVGKTRLAIILGFVYSKIGILVKNKVKVVSRPDLVAQYVGQSAPLTRQVCMNSLEGVIFVDEAYSLTQCPDDNGKRSTEHDFGGESVTELVNFLDKYIGLSIMIVAGYEKDMRNCFMTFNQGLSRRFPYVLTLTNYNNEELTDILISNMEPSLSNLDTPIYLNEYTSNLLYSYITTINFINPDILKNQAGDMLNLAQKILLVINSSKKPWNNENQKKK